MLDRFSGQEWRPSQRDLPSDQMADGVLPGPPGLAPGTRVTQGQRIGDVGTTGRSTGPHLHYELWIDGNPVDPVSIDTGTGTATLEGAALAAFRTERARVDAARAGRAP